MALDDLRHSGPFGRIWIYDQWSKAVPWKSESLFESLPAPHEDHTIIAVPPMS